MDRPLLDRQHPEIFKAYVAAARAVRTAAKEAGLDRKLIELINLRASQINGCAYCLDVHARAALDNGEDPRRITVLPAWREAGVFTPGERAALALAEAVTTIQDDSRRDAAFAAAAEHFTEAQVSVLNWTLITINAFNRVSILSEHRVTLSPE
ncbi:carboxymuconolactone decarboxylase family protein [Lolliginicoccus suaedae]|uniref:carboxymuconolactone decarboxylase family protein n=1 Tax=Lolliginicoccus suaedae TaxID=2605429 RepID=UPI0011EC181B|nr:carboxymuconolactone decarboxylase family protein [Lolliginicoccus suaedae]